MFHDEELVLGRYAIWLKTQAKSQLTANPPSIPQTKSALSQTVQTGGLETTPAQIKILVDDQEPKDKPIALLINIFLRLNFA